MYTRAFTCNLAKSEICQNRFSFHYTMLYGWSIHYEVSTQDLLVRVKTLHDDLVRDIL
jgi:hypothetical protein